MVRHRWVALAAACVALHLVCTSVARAHEFKLDAVISAFIKIEPNEAHLVIRAPLYLFRSARFPVKGAEVDVANSTAALERALDRIQQDVTLFAAGQPLKARHVAGRLSLPSDRSFDGYEDATAHVAAPPESDMRIVADQGYVDAELLYPIRSPDAVISILSSLGPDFGSSLKLTVRYLSPDGQTRAMVISGGAGTVELNPTWFSAASSFVKLGVEHIVTGVDHLLFLLCVIIPLRGLRPLLTVVTGFTLAHSFTLLGSAFGLAPQGSWFPPFVEMMIAVSIVYTALENIMGVDLRRRVLLTMLFGLVHGFGFSYGLQQEMQFAGSHLLVSLFAFNLGIEIGQITVLALMLPVLALVTKYVFSGRTGFIILCALLANVGWNWMTERWDALSKVPWPVPDLASLPPLMAWVAGLLLATGALVAVVARLRLEPATSARQEQPSSPSSVAGE